MAPNTFRKLQGKHVLVIGGSSGIGYGVAEGALAEGAVVTIASSNPTRVDKTVSTLKSEYGAESPVQGIVCDLSTKDCEARLETLFDEAVAGHHDKPVNHVVFTATKVVGAIDNLNNATVDSIIATGQLRMIVPILLAKVARRRLPRDTSSSLTLTSGISADKPIADWTALNFYAGGLLSLARSLAVDMAPIRANVVKPGMVETELWDVLLPDQRAAIHDQACQLLVGGPGTPADVAEAYLWLMKDRFVTGTIASSDGGAQLK